MIDDVEYAFFCEGLEKQYKQAKEDSIIFEILKILKLDKKHSDTTLVQTVDYFNEKNGLVEIDAPTDFLTEREKRMVHRDGEFHPELYCMLLAQCFSDAIRNKSAFIQDSLKFSFDEKTIQLFRNIYSCSSHE